MEVSNVQVRRHVGKYNLANMSEEGAQIVVRFMVDGKIYSISDVVETGSQHDYEGDDISDAVDAISNSIERYWICTGRKETQEKIAFFWKHEALIRKAYAASQARGYQRLAAQNSKLARQYLDEAMAPVEPSSDDAAAS